ncbi:MAG: hypothetical protein U5J83_04740 [Bryobacterales bacterium]|nr:hypothetical protein [Bryobacterales bacterium]
MDINQKNFSPNVNLNRTTAINRTVNPALALPSLAEVYSQLTAALQRITTLENQVHRLEEALHIGPTGDIEIAAKGALRLSGASQVIVDGKHGGVTLKDSIANSVTLSSAGVNISTNALAKLTAASIHCTVAMATFTGGIKCKDLHAVKVVANSFTPGVGNIL